MMKRIGRVVLGMVGAFLICTPATAAADDFCTHLRALLSDPPSGFVALRGASQSAIWPRWSAKPFLPHANCEITGTADRPDAELRCVINDKATPSVTTAFFAQTRASIEACLKKLPNGASFTLADSKNAADGFVGMTTIWDSRSKTEHVQIELTNDTVFGAARTSFSVTYRKR